MPAARVAAPEVDLGVEEGAPAGGSAGGSGDLSAGRGSGPWEGGIGCGNEVDEERRAGRRRNWEGREDFGEGAPAGHQRAEADRFCEYPDGY